MTIVYGNELAHVDWQALKEALIADRFDNGRSTAQLQQSFENSRVVCLAWCNGIVVGTARALSDDVCNAYLLDLWTNSTFRRQGIATRMIEHLLARLAGQHVYLQADRELRAFYQRLGFQVQPIGMSQIVGNWLVHERDRST